MARAPHPLSIVSFAPVPVSTLIFGLVFGVVLDAGCGGGGPGGPGSPDGGGTDGGADLGQAAYPPWSASNPAICGQGAYTWQPADKVGAVLQSQAGQSVSALDLNILSEGAYLEGQINFQHAITHDVQSAVIRYQTQDRGQLVDATAMVVWPTSGGTSFPTALFLHPTLGYTDGCAPSLNVGDSTSPMTLLSLLIASTGYVAVFPDYLNQKSLGTPSAHVTPYLLMEPTAIASLDALRAAQAYVKAQGKLSAPSAVYVWGHSQGAQAVEYVTALQPDYAPEFTLKAAAAVSPPSDLLASARLNFAGPAPNYDLGEAVAYTWTDYYGGTPVTSALLPPWSTLALTELQSYCNSNYKDPITAVTDPTQVFTSEYIGLLTQGATVMPWSCWVHYNDPVTMGPPMNPSVPMLYVTGNMDTTVYPAANDPVSAKWCGQGVKIEYLQCSGADHAHTIIDSVDDVLDFFTARQDGQPLPATACQPQPATKCKSTP